MMLLSGDIQENPGPESVSSLADEERDLSSCSTESLDHLFSIMHLNIQCIVPKLDLVETESMAYDIMVYSESWLKPTVTNDSVTIANFHKPFRCDRDGRLGGGVIIYLRDSYYCKRRNDLEIINFEAVWVEVHIKNKTILVGGFYRPINAKVEYYDLVSENVDRACNTQIKDIVLLGDFKCDASKPQNNRILNLMQQYNFDQLVTEPTHFTENSSSLLDLIFVRNKTNVFKAGVLNTFIENQVRYHVPTAVIFTFLKNIQKPYKRHIWLYEKGNYDEHRLILNNIDWDSITDDNDFDIVAEKFTDTLIKAAEKTVPNKTVTIRPDD